MKHIYILCSCDIWKSWSSMSLIMATTSLRKIKAEIVRQIKAGHIEYDRSGNSKTEQIKMFRKDFKEHDESFVFNNLKFGYVEDVLDGERQ